MPPHAEWTVDDQVNEDVAEAVQTVLSLTDASEVLWVGHSWGGLLQVLFQVRKAPLASRIKGIVAIGSPFTFGLQRTTIKAAPLLRRWIEWTGSGLPLRRLAWLFLPALLLWPRWPRGWIAPLAPLTPGVGRRVLASMTEDIPVGLLRQTLAWIESGKLTDRDGIPDERHFDPASDADTAGRWRQRPHCPAGGYGLG